MSNSRRICLKETGISSMAVLAGSSAICNEKIMPRASPGVSGPLVISTRKNGIEVNKAAKKKIMEGYRAFDAFIMDEIHNSAIGIPCMAIAFCSNAGGESPVPDKAPVLLLNW